MKKRTFILLPLILMMAGCTSYMSARAEGGEGSGRKVINFDELEANEFDPQPVTGELGGFNLVTPGDSVILDSIHTFSWTESENAEKYTLEICSDERFVSDNSKIDYYIQENIISTSFTINSSLMLSKEITTYYWRVFAYNASGRKMCNSIFTFDVKAPEIEEFEFDIGDADDWTLHPLGSHADIDIDTNDFFGNGKDSLVVSFKEEDTNQGIPESDGWIIVTKTIEKTIFGTDSLFFNMYYAGQDATVLIRLVDLDNEYWYTPVKISNDAKQSVVVKFEDFVQRKKDVTIADEVFDYQRIKYLEIVFEKTFGDGVLVVGNFKAIKYDSYRYMFIDLLNFDEYEETDWVNDSYNFERVINGTELEIKYYGTATEEHDKINGYGFAKLYAHRYFAPGDAIKVSVKYSGAKGSNVVIRIYEEDTDRWSYKIPFSSIDTEGYTDFIIPFKAFAKSDTPEGRRQFYFISNLQFGLEGQYGTGSTFFKDFEVVKKKDYATETTRTVLSDGVIDDFNNYKYSSDLYMIWEMSEGNKDEYMALNSSMKVGGSSNPFCGQFEYKSDMEAATYTLPVTIVGNFSSISIWAKDNSLKSGDDRLANVENYSPDFNVIITLNTGEIFKYCITSLERTWNEYIIPFTSFTLSNPLDFINGHDDISVDTIKSIGFSMHYFYHDYMGKAYPVYTNSNPVLVDNIYFGHATSYSKIVKEMIIHEVDGIALVDDFESYNTTADMEDVWFDGRDYDYQHKELSNVVSSEGGAKSGAFQYKVKSDSPSYYVAPSIGSDVTARGIKLSIKSELNAEVYINFYLRISSSNLQYRYTINITDDGWNEYSIGYNNFVVVEGSETRALTVRDLPSITRISIGVKYTGTAEDTLYNLYVDNIKFDASLTYSTNSKRTIA